MHVRTYLCLFVLLLLLLLFSERTQSEAKDSEYDSERDEYDFVLNKNWF